MLNMDNTLLSYYASHGVMTDPGDYSGLLDGLPDDIPELCKVVQGLLLHPYETGLYDVDLTSVQRKEVNIRPVREMLKLMQRLDGHPLSEPACPANGWSATAATMPPYSAPCCATKGSRRGCGWDLPPTLARE